MIHRIRFFDIGAQEASFDIPATASLHSAIKYVAHTRYPDLDVFDWQPQDHGKDCKSLHCLENGRLFFLGVTLSRAA